jgi:nucleotide-binding universal stress UspA family protein
MRNILIPIDGTKQDEAAVRAVAASKRQGANGVAIHLLNVQPPVRSYAAQFLGLAAIRDYQRVEAGKALAGARRALDEAGMPFTVHIRIGESVETIAAAAAETAADEIVIAGGGDTLVGDLMRRLLVARLVHRSKVPVVVVRSQRPDGGRAIPAAGLRPSTG